MIDSEPSSGAHAALPTRRVAVAAAFERVEREFEVFIRRKGLKLTSQRRRILKRVFATNRHFTAEEIHEAFRRGRDEVSRATVYRTLSLLVEGGFLDMLELGGDTKRYEHILGREHHDHLMCIRCGHVIEFQEERIEQLQEQVAKEHGFRITSHSLRIFGTCKKCLAEADGRVAGAGG
ncbi:MAG: transcriptional repressor [Planctomycetes bacterium]|nr:transcriptional repressor [Planctomycetota bacterium]